MKLIKSIIIFLVIIAIISIVGYIIVKNNNSKNGNVGDESVEKAKYINITANQMVEETKGMNKEDYVILDVRTKAEYDEERIPNSVLLTLDEIGSKASSVLPNKDIKIYVYCRSGRRSMEAAYKLIDLGYKYVYDFGGIIDYPYEKIK